jgi:hypothetical protein
MQDITVFNTRKLFSTAALLLITICLNSAPSVMPARKYLCHSKTNRKLW